MSKVDLGKMLPEQIVELYIKHGRTPVDLNMRNSGYKTCGIGIVMLDYGVLIEDKPIIEEEKWKEVEAVISREDRLLFQHGFDYSFINRRHVSDKSHEDLWQLGFKTGLLAQEKFGMLNKKE